MVSVFDVAKYILEKQGRMSTWKLQKLCYYSQAWHFTWTERRLIEEDFQAWRNGPVCPELFFAHQGRFMIESKDLPKGDAKKLNDDEEFWKVMEMMNLIIFANKLTQKPLG